MIFQSSATTVDTADEENNMSVISVKERAKHLNRIESETELMQQTSVSSLGATRKIIKDPKKVSFTLLSIIYLNSKFNECSGSDLRSKSNWLEAHQRLCVVYLSRTLYLLLLIQVQPNLARGNKEIYKRSKKGKLYSVVSNLFELQV